ncbi:hypothetical protein C8Q74DRAFT_1301384 [Fomes fomentarius]|nr:hypothetical protein C8Q74DRAFT_1301384 [Fomes fomentarius]
MNQIGLNTDLDGIDVDCKEFALVLQQSDAAERWHDVHGSPDACTSPQGLLVPRAGLERGRHVLPIPTMACACFRASFPFLLKHART